MDNLKKDVEQIIIMITYIFLILASMFIDQIIYNILYSNDIPGNHFGPECIPG